MEWTAVITGLLAAVATIGGTWATTRAKNRETLAVAVDSRLGLLIETLEDQVKTSHAEIAEIKAQREANALVITDLRTKNADLLHELQTLTSYIRRFLEARGLVDDWEVETRIVWRKQQPPPSATNAAPHIEVNPDRPSD